ncbi:META domain-containing protein [Streptomyces sp. NBC_00199]|uniref:META domain-containing protein n=1 Tax=Streptomyces sp. NBC_00199 TaxID=2975678 RepID=UPI002252F81E|nr:META domain-containing protein [Streptomyces sp. NBC_00199]MCX5265987.1 META domain-containing protein [Streptomyces sp. NBC_00199]
MSRQTHSPTHAHPYRRRTALAAALLLVPLAAACGGEKAGDQPGSGEVRAEQPVTGVRWNVDSVSVDGAVQQAPSGAYVEIEDGRATGNYGCNHFTAKAAVQGDRVRFSEARSTRMACEKQPMAFERTLAATLADGTLTAEVDGATLTLGTADGDQVRLTGK